MRKLVVQATDRTRLIHWRRTDNLVRLALVLAALAMTGTAYLLRDQITLDQVGYGGIAFASLIASAGLIIPVPALGAVCAGGIWLNPIAVGLVAGSAETLGELSGYFLGYGSQVAISRSRWYIRVEPWMQRRGWLPLFLLSLFPNPFFDIAGLAAGALHYPIWRFLTVVWAGKVLKFLIVTHLCAYGKVWVLDLLG